MPKEQTEVSELTLLASLLSNYAQRKVKANDSDTAGLAFNLMRIVQDEQEAKALDHECPTCIANRGAKCISEEGKNLGYSHTARIDLVV